MKIAILFFLGVIQSLPGSAQNWQPFPKGQTSYYTLESSTGMSVETFLMDSSAVAGEKETLYFNSKGELPDSCYVLVKEHFYSDLHTGKIDSLLLSGDSLLYIDVGDYPVRNDTFIFKPGSRKGDKWITNKVLIECIEIRGAVFLGQTDSVKVFECTGRQGHKKQIVLSKSFGFLGFIPFYEFLFNGFSQYSTQYQLIGFKSPAGSSGYIQPDFSDYFHLSAGDMLFWQEHDFDGISHMVTNRSRIDSITYAYLGKDSVYYDYHQVVFDDSGSVLWQGDLSRQYLRQIEGKILTNATSWIGFLPAEELGKEVFYFDKIDLSLEDEDTITTATYTTSGLFVDTASCEIYQLSDAGGETRYSTREGEIYHGTRGIGDYSLTLVGSIIDAKHWGKTEIPTGLFEVFSEDIKVYPNPSADQLHIDATSVHIKDLSFYDLYGNRLFTQPFSESIRIDNFASGIYILVLRDTQNRRMYRRVIKN